MISSDQRLARFLVAVMFVALGIALGSDASGQGVERTIPRPLAHHPGNIFVEGESVRISLPKRGVWQLLDADNQVVKSVGVNDTLVELGPLPVGFYRLKNEDYPDWVSLGVIAPLKMPTPQTSPIALDVAMSWFYPEDRMADVASLCALVGVNWVRDRLSWAEVEPQRGEFKTRTRYDAAAEIQSAAGLKVLQVYHASPKWANPETKRFPIDLRDCYRFLKGVAARWKGKVLAYEPWNEADIEVFGGHTGAEMASLQKAAYWAIKSVSPDTIVCWNVFATSNAAHLEDIAANDVLPYCDTFNFHHYRPLEDYPSLYESFRQIAGPRPLWVTECALPLRWSGDPQKQELSDEDLFEQARRLVKVFACSLHEGTGATFYFLLPHYVEGPTQFGIIRRDLTPRPAYVSLAAVGRLLADARPCGKLGNRELSGYLFRAEPDGEPRLVLVLWSKEPRTIDLPVKPVALYDYLGRRIEKVAEDLVVTSTPIFAVFHKDSLDRFDFVKAPQAKPVPVDGPCPVVLQTLWPSNRIELRQSAYRVKREQNNLKFPVFIYNFGPSAAEGTVRVTVPPGWAAEFIDKCRLAAGERAEQSLELALPTSGWTGVAVIRIEGDFGTLGRSVLSFRLISD
ncbi:hypothetical protein [Thermogutta sp.]|uniref:hypothetical protein n=1 Tax=Thermogutta sp. TaxID=1962930 RepID=UPI003C7DA443